MNVDALTREELLVARVKCDYDILFFTRFFYILLRGSRFIVNHHHEEICDQLDRVDNYELKLLNINIPPRYSKTELAAVNYIARGIGMNPKSNWLYVTASDELRSETSVRIRDIVCHPYFKIMYGVNLKKDQNSKNLWRTTEGGGLKTATIFGQITGFGAGQIVQHDEELEDYIRDFEGCQVWDDINKIDDADQQNANNDKVTRVIFNTLLSRENSADTPIINIQQRAGMEDATEQMKIHYGDNDKAHFLKMPIITDGAPLWGWKHNIEAIQKLKSSPKTGYIFETQYMQDPQPKEGLIFGKSELQYYDELPPRDQWDLVWFYSDPADEGIDHHSMPIGIISGGVVYVDDVLFTRDNLTVASPQILAKIDIWYPVNQMWIESNNHGAMFIRDLRQKTDTPIYGLKNTTNKIRRMLAQEGWVKENVKFKRKFAVESQYDKFMTQIWKILRDGTIKKDDAPDSISGAAFMIRRNYGYLFSENKKK